MTDGRYEASINLRPGGWDSRVHWTKTHKCFKHDGEHVRDHMERESCPFHDLRACGCFQPEYAGLGVEAFNLRPDELMKRPDGNRFATAGASVQPRTRGMGGLPIPHDVEPAPSPKHTPTSPNKPWKSGTKTAPLFGNYEYLAVATEAGPAAAPAGVFHTGKASIIGAPQRHVPEPFKDPSAHPRAPFRLATGIARRKDVVGPAPPCPPLDKAAKRAASAPRAPYQPNKSLMGTFNPHPAYLPDPWAPAGIKIDRRPLFTYAAKTKRSMPIAVPWKHGSSAAEPPKPPPADVTVLASLTHSVSTRGRPIIGEKTLLR